jgi:peroxiredoxin
MITVALMAASGGYYVAMLVAPGAEQQSSPLGATNTQAISEVETADLIGQPRPDFTLTDIVGASVSVDQFDGQMLLINFWATWCTPCVEEMPMLSELQKKYRSQSFQIVGIALDDPARAAQFAQELGLDYTVLLGTAEAILVGRQYGNRAGMLPYSVLIDSQGIIRWTHLGALDLSELETQITALL